MPDPTAWTRTRSQIAVTLRDDPAADVTSLRLRLRAERLADHVCRALAETPPLTAEQRNEIADLLRSSIEGDRDVS